MTRSSTILLAAAVALAGCGKGGDSPAEASKNADGKGDPKGGGGGGGGGGGKAPVQAPSRGPEHAVYSLVDNRLSAHLERGGGLLLPAGSAGMAKYTRFGNPEKIKQRPWELKQKQGEVAVGRITGTKARVDVPLTEAMLAGNPVVRIRAFSTEARAITLRVNEHDDINTQLAGGGWSTLEVAIPAGQLVAGDNQIQIFVKGEGLPVEWIQVGGSAPAEGALAFYDAGDKALVLPEGGAMVWYAFAPENGLVTGNLADGACQVAVTAEGEDGQVVEGTLEGLGSAVDLDKLSGQAIRLSLAAKGCPTAKLTDAALVVPGEAPTPPDRGAPPKYVVMIVMDSLRADRVKPWNPEARPEVPTFEKLAADSAVFLQHYVQGNESRVSHASLWTSMYPVRHGYLDSKERLNLDFVTIDEVAKSAGMYVAGASGNGYVSPKRWNFGTKWDRFTNHIHEELGLKAEDILDRGWAMVADKKEPWFLYLGFIDTHVSWRAKKPWIDKYSPGYSGRFEETFSGGDAAAVAEKKITMTEAEIEHVRALYDSNVSYQDDQLRLLIEKLQAAGIWEQTMLIITADHGDEQWEEGGRVGHGMSNRDMLVHVPLLIHYPPLFKPGAVAEGVEVLDVVPSLADALGVAMDPAWQGESLIPLTGGVGRGYPRMSFNSMLEDSHGARIAHWKVQIGTGSTPKVYDLATDRDEMKDLWGQDGAHIGARAVLDPLWLLRANNMEWKKSQWGNAANVSSRFATDLGE
jgi:arylsulfatase A-like enzyme